MTYAVAPGDIVGTDIGLPWLPGRFGIGIGNTDTTGDNFPRLPLRIITGDHDVAYYKDNRVIKFLSKGDNYKYEEILDYQNKVWGGDIKTKTINFSNEKLQNGGE